MVSSTQVAVGAAGLATLASYWYNQSRAKKTWYLSSVALHVEAYALQSAKRYTLPNRCTLCWEKTHFALYDPNGQLIWSTIPSQAFLGVGQINASTISHYFFGFCETERPYDTVTTAQSIDHALQDSNGTVVISGALLCQGERIP